MNNRVRPNDLLTESTQPGAVVSISIDARSCLPGSARTALVAMTLQHGLEDQPIVTACSDVLFVPTGWEHR
eukprot:15471175-Alexandrium_andersonii.AAC.1